MRARSTTIFNFENDPGKLFVEGLTFEETVRYAYHLFWAYPNLHCVAAPDGNGGIMEVLSR